MSPRTRSHWPRLVLALLGVLNLCAALPAAAATPSILRPPVVDRSALAIMTPSAGETMSARSRVDVSVRVSGGIDRSSIRATANGAPLLIGRGTRGRLYGSIPALALRIGTNRVTVRGYRHDGQQVYDTVRFTAAGLAGTATVPAEADTHANTPFVPVTTRVLRNGVWEVDLGGQHQQAAGTNSTSQGYQVVVLDRAYTAPTTGGTFVPLAPNPYVNLPVVSNTVYSVSDEQDFDTMQPDLLNAATYDDCSADGCYVIVSSLAGMGYTSCPNQDSSARGCGFTTAEPGALFARMGGTPSASYAPASTGYSLITTVNVADSAPVFPGPGGGTESLGCQLVGVGSAGHSSCTPRVNAGTVTGAFVDGVLPAAAGFSSPVRFTATHPVSITARSINAATGVNTVTVGTRHYRSDPTIVPAGSRGFQVVALDRSTLSLLTNQTFTPVTASVSQGLEAMANLFADPEYAGENVIWVVASLGDVIESDSFMYDVGLALEQVGGSFSVFNQLGVAPPGASGCTTISDYALIGVGRPDTPASDVPGTAGLEASGPVACVTDGPSSAPARAVSETALFTLDSRSLFSPQLSSTAIGTSKLQQSALQLRTKSWPPARGVAAGTTPTTGQALAYSDLSDAIENAQSSGFPSSNHDIRYYYTRAIDTGLSPSSAIPSGWYGVLKAAKYPSHDPGYSRQTFRAVLSELKLEINDLVSLANFQSVFLSIFDDAGTGTIADFTKAYSIIDKLASPKNTQSVIADVASIFGTYAADLLPILLPESGELVGPALDVVSQSVAFSLSLSESSTTGASMATLTSTWQSLIADLGTLFDQAALGFQTLSELAVTDYRRLAGVSAAIRAYNFPPLVPRTDPEKYGQPPSQPTLSTALSNGLTVMAYDALLGNSYRTVTVRALWGDVAPNVSPTAYPGLQLSPGGSIHRVICTSPGTCPAEAAGHGNPGAYFFSLQDVPQQPDQGPGYFYWQTTFMYLADCADDCRLSVTLPSLTLISILFDPVNTPIQVDLEGTNTTAPALGLWPGYFWGPYGPVPASTNRQAVADILGGYGPGDQKAPGDEGNPLGGPPPGGPTTSTAAPTPSSASSSPGLADTGPAAPTGPLLVLAVGALALGLLLNQLGSMRRRRCGGRHR